MFWLREIAGWLLVIVALYLMSLAVTHLSDLDEPRVVEALIMTLASIGMLKAGILLIRISTAARICRKD